MKKTIVYMIVFGGMIILMLAISGCKTAGPAVESTKKTVKVSPDSANVAVQSSPAKPVNVSSASKKPAKKAAKKPRRTDAGHLSVDKLIHDFGVIEPSKRQKAVFVLTNDGKEDLKITKVNTTCGCTITNFKRNTILKPGESFDLEITYKSGSSPVKVRKGISVLTAAPSMPASQKLTLTADIKKLVDVKPKNLRFEIKESSKNQGVIVLESTDGEAFKVISSYKSGSDKSDEPVIITFDKEKKAARHELQYTADVKKLRKTPKGGLTIELSHPKLKNVYLSYESIFPFSAHPPNKHFIRLKPGVPQKEVIRVVSNFGQDFELGNITSQKGLIEVLGTTKSKDGYTIEISLTATAEETSDSAKDENDKKPQKKKVRTKSLREQISIEIKDHPEDTLKVFCYGTVIVTL